jgi:hypothetical protein
MVSRADQISLYVFQIILNTAGSHKPVTDAEEVHGVIKNPGTS